MKHAAKYAIRALDLEISPVPVTIVLKGKTDTYGDSIDFDHKIVIRLFKTDQWLQTLFHELEHARQFIYCELTLEHNHAVWHGDIIERNPADYWNEPWEVQARKTERKLFKHYRRKFLTKLL